MTPPQKKKKKMKEKKWKKQIQFITWLNSQKTNSEAHTFTPTPASHQFHNPLLSLASQILAAAQLVSFPSSYCYCLSKSHIGQKSLNIGLRSSWSHLLPEVVITFSVVTSLSFQSSVVYQVVFFLLVLLKFAFLLLHPASQTFPILNLPSPPPPGFHS